MRLALLSDIHGNEPALRAALATAGALGAQRIIVAGDVVGDGPSPAECVRLLADRPDIVAIRGNVDREVLRLLEKKRRKLVTRLEEGTPKARNRAWTALRLGEDEARWLADLPAARELEESGRRVLVVHGSPLGDTDYVYPSLTPAGLERKLAGREGPPPHLLVTAHSHVPFAKRIGETLVTNCGSVGRPADGDPRGSLAIAEIGTAGTLGVEIFRFEYPLDELERLLRERRPPGIELQEYLDGVKR
jgi:putative phosphoesterase